MYPIVVNEIKYDESCGGSNIKGNSIFHKEDIGSWVSVNPCIDNEEKKTYLGIYIGDHHDPCFSYDKENQILLVRESSRGNPAIFIPELKKVVLGRECWWSLIKSEKDLRQITDKDINNVWYVKALKEFSNAAG